MKRNGERNWMLFYFCFYFCFYLSGHMSSTSSKVDSSNSWSHSMGILMSSVNGGRGIKLCVKYGITWKTVPSSLHRIYVPPLLHDKMISGLNSMHASCG